MGSTGCGNISQSRLGLSLPNILPLLSQNTFDLLFLSQNTFDHILLFRILLTAFFFKEYFWSLYIFQNTQNTHQNHDFHWHCPIYCLSPNSFDHFLLSQNNLIASFSLLLLVSYSFLRILESLIPFSKYLTIYFLLRILLVSYFVLSLTNKILIIYLKWLNSLRIL